MSKVADALRRWKAESEIPGAISDDLAPFAAPPPGTPWELADAPAAVVVERPTVPSPTPLRLRESDDVPAAIREHLAGLAQVLLRAREDGTRVRSILFVPVAVESASGRLCIWTAHLLAQQTSSHVCVVSDQGDARPHVPSGAPAPPGDGSLTFSPERDPDVHRFLNKTTDNLWFLATGTQAGNARPATPETLRAWLPELHAMFEYVLVDASAFGGQPNVIALGHMVDGVVLVVQANGTRRETARRSVRDLQAADIRVLGAVLTNRTFPIPGALYKRL